jgi:hypothetical protein
MEVPERQGLLSQAFAQTGVEKGTMKRRPIAASRKAKMHAYKRAHDVIQLAVALGLHDYHHGNCGPAAIAINKVLFRGKGLYCIVMNKKGKRSGHVAVQYPTTSSIAMFDYQGRCDFNEMAAYGLIGYVAREQPFQIVTDAPETLVRRHFCPKHARSVAGAVLILEFAKRIVSMPEGKRRLRAYRREIARRTSRRQAKSTPDRAPARGRDAARRRAAAAAKKRGRR